MLAHPTANLIDDYYDYKNRIDVGDSLRLKYTKHFMRENLITIKTFWITFAVFMIIAIAAGVYFSLKYNSILPFILGAIGLLIMFGYGASPFKLKYNSLGELAIIIVWGPLMLGGTYYALTGIYDWNIIIMSIPYAIVVGAVIMGKHLDKYEHDLSLNVKTLPVVMGKKPAIIFTLFLLILGWLFAIILAIIGYYPLWTIVFMLLFVPTLIKAIRYSISPPEREDYGHELVSPKGPMWYLAITYITSRRFGWLLTFGLLTALILPDINFLLKWLS